MEELRIDTEHEIQDFLDERPVYVYRSPWTLDELDRRKLDAHPHPLRTRAKLNGEYKEFIVMGYREGAQGFDELLLTPA